MSILTVNANSKVNFSIDILGVRDDGYHLVNMIMQTIPLYDKIVIYTPADVDDLRDDILNEIVVAKQRQDDKIKFLESKGIEAKVPNPADKIFITCTNPKLPVNSSNIAYKAAMLMKEAAGFNEKLCLHIRKKIPVGGGLGGSSADAAAVLLGLNKYFGLNYPLSKLLELGKRLGSDVPFLIQGGTCLASGTGTELRQIKPLKKGYMVIINPGIFLQTEIVYSRLDQMRISEESHPDTELLLNALEAGDLETFAANMKNILEKPAFALFPELTSLKREIINTKPLGAAMSGSGSTFFAIYDTKEDASRALKYFRSKNYFSIVLDLADEAVLFEKD